MPPLTKIHKINKNQVNEIDNNEGNSSEADRNMNTKLSKFKSNVSTDMQNRIKKKKRSNEETSIIQKKIINV